MRDFPGGPGVKNLPSNAGDKGQITGWGTKILHAAGQVNPRVATREKPAVKSPACRKEDTEQPKKEKGEQINILKKNKVLMRFKQQIS